MAARDDGIERIERIEDVKSWLARFLPLEPKSVRAWEEHVDAFVQTHEDMRDHIARQLLPKLHMMARSHLQSSAIQSATLHADMLELAVDGGTR